MPPHRRHLLKGTLAALGILEGPNARAQTQNNQGNCSAQLQGSHNNNIVINCNSESIKSIDVSYFRLFGSFSVPLALSIFDSSIVRSNFAPDHYHGLKNNLIGRYVEIEKDFFYNSKNILENYLSNPITNLQLWKDLAGNEDVAAALYMKEKQISFNEGLCAFSSWPIDEGSGADADEYLLNALGATAVKIKNNCDNFSFFKNSNIGFTFALFQNKSSEPVKNLSINYFDGYSTSRLKKFDKDKFLKNETKKYFNQINDGSFLDNLEDPISSEIRGRSLNRKRIFISEIMPNQSICMILNVYYANSDKLPMKYMSGTYILDTLSGNGFEIAVRRPSGLDAARIPLEGFGWRSQ